MTVLYPGDSVHLTFWYDANAHTVEFVRETYRKIFTAHGVNMYSDTAVTGGNGFPPQVIVFRDPQFKRGEQKPISLKDVLAS